MQVGQHALTESMGANRNVQTTLQVASRLGNNRNLGTIYPCKSDKYWTNSP